MAGSLGLAEFYNYYYSITSENVHFNPRVLMGIGLGKNKNNFSFSTTNFKQYYKDFGEVYGAILFTKFSRSFEKD